MPNVFKQLNALKSSGLQWSPPPSSSVGNGVQISSARNWKRL